MLTSDVTREAGTISRGLRMYRRWLRRSLRPFVIAVVGAATFAAATASSALMIRWVIDHVVEPRFDQGEVSAAALWAGLVGVVALGLVKCVGIVVRRRFAFVTQMSVAHAVRTEVIEALGSRPLPWLEQTSSGQLIANAGVDVEAVHDAFGPLPLATGVAALLIAAVTGLLIIDPVLGGIAAALLPVLALGGVFYERYTTPVMHRLQHSLGVVSDIAYESIDGAAVVSAFGAAGFETARFAEAAAVLRDTRLQLLRLRGWFEVAINAVPTLSSLVLVVVGAYRARSGDVSVGDVSGVLYLFALMAWPLRVTGWLLNGLVHGVAGHDRVEQLLADAPPPVTPPRRPPPGIAVECSHLSFAYPDGETRLHDVNLRIAVGRRTAIVGPTASGKSTLLQVLAGLREPGLGHVAVAEHRGLLAFQEAVLLSDSISNNVMVGAVFSTAEVDRALGLAQAEFVGELAGGAGTVVGERGATLSGGQRQRIALARALVRRPDVLMLDDVTSALDPTTEAAVLGAIGEMRDVTVVMVTNRSAAINSCDNVVFLADGRVLATGTPAELYDTVAAYRDLIDAASVEA